MYIRVKRQKATVFFQVEPTDTVLRVKSMIENLMQTPPESQKLYMDGTELEDKRSLAELKVESDGILVLALRQQGALHKGRSAYKGGRYGALKLLLPLPSLGSCLYTNLVLNVMLLCCVQTAHGRRRR